MSDQVDKAEDKQKEGYGSTVDSSHVFFGSGSRQTRDQALDQRRAGTPSDPVREMEMSDTVQDQYSSGAGNETSQVSQGVFSNRTAGHRSAGQAAHEQGAQGGRRYASALDGHQPARGARNFPLGEIREDSDPREADDHEGTNRRRSEAPEEEKAATVRTEDREQRMYNKIHPLQREKLSSVFPVLRICMGPDDSSDDEAEDLGASFAYSRRGPPGAISQEGSFLAGGGSLGPTVRGHAGEEGERPAQSQPPRSRVLQRIVNYFQEIVGLRRSHDPFAILGPGIGSFHMLQLRLVLLFLFLYLVHLPVIKIFHEYGFYEKDGYYIIKRSLGNMGFSKTMCESHSLQFHEVEEIACANGQLSTLVDWGFQTIYENQLKCHRTEENSCNKYLDNDGFAQFYADNCLENKACQIKDITQFLQAASSDNTKEELQEIKQCTDISTRFFIQYMCKQTKEDIQIKTDKASFCIYVAIFTSFCILLFAEWGKKMVNKMSLKHDVNTVTPSDYVLHMFMSSKQSTAFENFYRAQKLISNLPRGEVFMLWLKREFAIFSEEQHVKVLRVDPIFDNRTLIDILRQRGYAIATNNMKLVRTLEDKIDVDKQYDAKICGAFLTFETEEVMKKAIKIWKTLDPKVKVERAAEPSIYIWENLSITTLQRVFNKLVVFVILFALMALAYKYQGALIKARLSPGRFENIECNFIRHQYDQYTDEAEATMNFQKQAFATWDAYYKLKYENYINGTLGCFCEEQYDQYGFDAVFQVYSQDGVALLPDGKTDKPAVKSAKICKQYLLYSKYKKFYQIILGASIFIINYAFYFITWPLVALIGYRRNVVEEYINCNMIVICYALDVTVLPIMIGMNFKEVDYFQNYFTGKFTDFEAGWYKTIGTQIAMTMTIFAFQPVFDFLREYLLQLGLRWYKAKYVYCNRDTEEDDYMTWLELYAGPEYYFYWRVAITHVTIFVCLLFGFCMPYLYFVGMFAMILQYAYDRARIAYFYRLPPMFNTRLTISLLQHMSAINTCGLCMLFWMMTNKQMFDNKIDPIAYEDEVRNSHHFIRDIHWSKLTTAQQALLLTISGLILLHVVQYSHQFYLYMTDPHQKLTLVEQNLPNYFDSLQRQHIEDFIEDYNHFREIGAKTLFSASQIEILQENLERQLSLKKQNTVATLKNRLMQGDPCYQAYRCPEYTIAFNNQNEDEKKWTKILLNLPMVPRSRIGDVRLRHDSDDSDGSRKKSAPKP